MLGSDIGIMYRFWKNVPMLGCDTGKRYRFWKNVPKVGCAVGIRYRSWKNVTILCYDIGTMKRPSVGKKLFGPSLAQNISFPD